MQKTPSLRPPTIRDVLNTLASAESRRERPQPQEVQPPDIARWIEIDPDILTLYKTCLDARVRYLEALATHGKGAPLSDVAADMADSAWCALEARVYELRMDAAALARANLRHKLAEEDARDKALRAQRDQTAREIRALSDRALTQSRSDIRQRRRDFFLFWYWCRFVLGAESNPGTASLSCAFAKA